MIPSGPKHISPLIRVKHHNKIFIINIFNSIYAI